MLIVKCEMADTDELAVMNKHLIDDEKSSNPMSVDELQERMTGFLSGEYEAFFFMDGNVVIGYALVKRRVSPVYLRQFFIKEEYRRKHYGTVAFQELLQHLGDGVRYHGSNKKFSVLRTGSTMTQWENKNCNGNIKSHIMFRQR